uniref:Protein kinase domain-containing protein n=1 Tax=Chromera velia CCMP2878 TaxID=1169474 RepID=A0A0G4FDY3_9ALVE|eukprot:Cvel_16533.t1-p1 / transcript=Cvel_16533.t1 / gene=Cvel_16533 / organism=Chromera_velia_CCMP2878 / gene_product=Mitogen-activated protein kinase homolog NTF6, putative / transcript_product=Mitogen-activated protein kinase homolog NTF6, putative / location=Cvel_scaffold1277:35922-39146(+) / protein_length=656 / sequence_SO=supercontig / SO=protein_coding / is_pseudo=false
MEGAQTEISQTSYLPVRQYFEATLQGSKFVIEDNFRPIRTIGRGSYGTVCVVQNTRDRSLSALKRMDHALENGVIAKRTLREVRILRFLNGRHENLLDIEDVYCSGGDAATYTEVYMRSAMMPTDLHSVLATRQPLSEDHHRFFMFQLLSALDFLHKARVLHRDVKPRNILLNQECDLKLCDFGLARTLPWRDPESAPIPNTRTRAEVDAPPPYSPAASPAPQIGGGRVPPSRAPALAPQGELNLPQGGHDQQGGMTSHVATRWYRAPELLWCAEEYDGGVDVWAAGCVLAEMLGGGEVLFAGRDSGEQLEQIVELLGMPPDGLLDEIPAGPLHFMRRVAERRDRNRRAGEGQGEPGETRSVVEILREKFPTASDSCLELLARMLSVHPSLRPSAAACLDSPWFQDSLAESEDDGGVGGSSPEDGEGDAVMGAGWEEETRHSPHLPPRDLSAETTDTATEESNRTVIHHGTHMPLDSEPHATLSHLMPKEAFAFERVSGCHPSSMRVFRRELLKEQAQWNRREEDSTALGLQERETETEREDTIEASVISSPSTARCTPSTPPSTLEHSPSHPPNADSLQDMPVGSAVVGADAGVGMGTSEGVGVSSVPGDALGGMRIDAVMGEPDGNAQFSGAAAAAEVLRRVSAMMGGVQEEST